MTPKRFSFPVQLTKSYKDSDGQMHVIGIASNTRLDFYSERFSHKALNKMVRFCKGTESAFISEIGVTCGPVVLLPTHHSTFDIGVAVDAWTRAADSGKQYELYIDFVLHEDYAEARSLYREVSSGNPEKQLSVGGWINPYNKNAYYWEDDSGSDRSIRVIDDLLLDHVAVTRPSFAANEGTSFVGAVVRSMIEENQDADVWLDAVHVQKGDITDEDLDVTNKEIDKIIEDTLSIAKAVVTYRNYPLADIGTSWSFSASDGNAVINKGGWALYKAVHTWFESGADSEKKSTYKLPHHKIIDGEVRTVWRGVAAAMVALMGGRRKLQVPENDRKGIYNHLSRHYRQFDKEPPEFKDTYSESDLVEYHKNKCDDDMLWLTDDIIDEMHGIIKEDKSMSEPVDNEEMNTNEDVGANVETESNQDNKVETKSVEVNNEQGTEETQEDHGNEQSETSIKSAISSTLKKWFSKKENELQEKLDKISVSAAELKKCLGDDEMSDAVSAILKEHGLTLNKNEETEARDSCQENKNNQVTVNEPNADDSKPEPVINSVSPEELEHLKAIVVALESKINLMESNSQKNIENSLKELIPALVEEVGKCIQEEVRKVDDKINETVENLNKTAEDVSALKSLSGISQVSPNNGTLVPSDKSVFAGLISGPVLNGTITRKDS